jgi:DNA segregation ATPase FtsK/SpoIIIE-like protein
MMVALLPSVATPAVASRLYHGEVSRHTATSTSLKELDMSIDMPGASIGAADPLLPKAAAWVAQQRESGEDILLYPISRLQREFRIGYSRTCALVEALALDAHWIIEFAEDGTRYARLRPGAKT